MTRILVTALFLSSFLSCAGSPRTPTAAVRRLVVVRSAGWDATRGELSMYERSGGAWSKSAQSIAVVLGRSGMAWGRGVHGAGAPSGRIGPTKREGDGKTPAGLFRLSSVFGYAPAAIEGQSAPYQQATDSWKCVDDSTSRHYNQNLDAGAVTKDWASAEDLRRPDVLYERLVVVDHNTAPAEPGAGSCIFLHVWRDAESTTAGCTAMPLGELERVVGFLDGPSTLLVALPDAEYRSLRDAWGLP